MKNLGVAISVSTVRGLGFSSIWMFSALYLRNILGLNFLEDGIIITGGTAFAAILQRYIGSLSDRIGHRITVQLSMFVSTILYLIMVISSDVRSSQLYFSIVFISLTISNSAQAPGIYAIVSGSSEIKTKGFSMLRIGNNAGWGIGPAIGGFAIYYSGFYYLFLFGFLCSLVAFIVSFLLKNVKAESGVENLPLRTENRFLIYLSIVALLLFIVQAQETVTLSSYVHIIRGLNYFQLGLIYMVNGIAVIATQGIVYKAIRRIGNYNSFIIGSVIYTLGFFSFAFFSTLYGLIAATIILTIGEDFAFPSSSAMVSLISKPENIGKNMGIFNAFLSIGRAFGPIIGAIALTVTSDPVGIWFIATVWGFASAVMFFFVFRNVSAIQENREKINSI